MKKKIIFIMSLAVTLFVAASCSNKSYKTYDKELSVISLNGYSDDNEEAKAVNLKDITYDGKMTLKFIEGEDYIPYIDVESYYTFIPESCAKGCKYADTKDEVDFIFELNNKKATVRILTKLEQIIFENQLAFIATEEDDTTSSALRTKYTPTYDTKNIKDYVINYKEYGFKTFRENDKTYLPLAFLDPLINASHVTGVFYNYDKLFTYSDPAALASFKYLDNGKETTAILDMKNKTTDVMPEYLRLFNKNYLYFIFDNFYGLKEQKGITKMSSYFESLDYSKMLLSDNAEVRGDAINLMLSTLDDNHTALINGADAWHEDNFKVLPQSMIKDRTLLMKILSDERNRVYKELNLNLNGVRYAKDGKTALITLDAFNEDNHPYDANKKVKTDEVLAESDQFFKLLTNLKEIDKKGGVSNVIIDMSVNRGGTSIVMTKILNLINKTNNGTITLHDSNSNTNLTMTTQIDSNNDGKYDDNDVYGNKFKFFILTSPIAFSCGTAMPFFVSHQKLGYIIGQTQGGGECAISQIALPNGQVVCYSSSMHVYTIEDDKMIGDEAGVDVDLPFSYYDFYDIEKLEKKIYEYEKLFK